MFWARFMPEIASNAKAVRMSFTVSGTLEQIAMEATTKYWWALPWENRWGSTDKEHL